MKKSIQITDSRSKNAFHSFFCFIPWENDERCPKYCVSKKKKLSINNGKYSKYTAHARAEKNWQKLMYLTQIKVDEVTTYFEGRCSEFTISISFSFFITSMGDIILVAITNRSWLSCSPNGPNSYADTYKPYDLNNKTGKGPSDFSTEF